MSGINTHSGLIRPVFFCLALTAGCFLGATAPQAQQNGLNGKAHSAQQQADPLPRIALRVGERKITAEVAADNASRARGLMFREELPADHGMLFVFPQAEQLCFWMKNTPLPLSIAFVDAAGVIINLADMQPYLLDTHCSLAPALYALEMEQGWFARHGIGAGATLQGLPRLVRRNGP